MSEASAIAAAPVAAKLPNSQWVQNIKKRGELTLGTNEITPGFSLVDPASNKASGFDILMGKMLAKYITGSPKVKLVATQSSTRITLLQNHSVDAVISTFTINPQRAKKINFAGPYFVSPEGIAVRKGYDKIQKPSDMNGKTVAATKGGTSAVAAKKAAPHAKLSLFGTYDEATQALLNGRVDAEMEDQSILVGESIRHPGKLQLVDVPQSFYPQPYGIGLPNNYAKAKTFVDQWLKKIEKAGVWARAWRSTVGAVVKGAPPSPPTIGSVPGS